MNNVIGQKISTRTIVLSTVGFVILVLLLASWRSVAPGEEGFIYRPYTGGVDTENIRSEGMYIIAPWNELISYNIRQQSATYVGKFLDNNGMTITITMTVNFRVQRSKSPLLHLEYGLRYFDVLIDPKVKGTIKDVIGRYSYKEVYSEKREQLAAEIENILSKDLSDKYIIVDFITIEDVDLPASVKLEIENKETQKERNNTAELKKIEQRFLADAKIETARGDSAKAIISAMAEAEAIRIKQEELRKSPQYIEYMKAERWNGELPRYYGQGGGMLFQLD